MINAGGIFVNLDLNSMGFNRGLTRMERRLGGFGTIATRTVLGVGGALATLGGFALRAAGNFEQSLNVFRAVSKATAGEMKQVSALTKALGADLTLPATSAKDAADALTELAKGGLTVRQSMDAVRGVLQLSVAAQIDVARAAQITARALKSFGLAANEAGRVADVLANAANASTGEIEDFALGFQQSSAVAKQFGLTINDTAAALMMMADAGIVGSDAGTSLKTMLQHMVPVTERAQKLMARLGIDLFDNAGRFIGLERAAGEYHRALSPLSQEQRAMALNVLFGSDAIRAANILFGEGSKKIAEYVDKTEKTGSAAALAAAKMKGFKGALEGLKSVVETLAINVGEKLLPVAERAIQRVSAMVTEMGPALTTNVGAAVERVVGFFQRNWPQIERFLKSSWEMAKGFASALGAVSKAVGPVIEKTIGWKAAGQFILGGIMAAKLLRIAAAFGVIAGAGGIGAASAAAGGLHGKLVQLSAMRLVIPIVIATIVTGEGKKLLEQFGLGGAFPTVAENGEMVFDPKTGKFVMSRPGGALPGGGMGGALSALGKFGGAISGAAAGAAATIALRAGAPSSPRGRMGTLPPASSGLGAAGGGGGALGGGGGGGGGAEAERIDRAELSRVRSRYRWFATHMSRILNDEVQAKLRGKLKDVREEMTKVSTPEDLSKVATRLDKFGSRFKAQIDKQMAAAKARLDRWRDRLSDALGKVTGAILSGFDRETDRYRTPAEKNLAEITERRITEDLAQAVADAERDLNAAREEGDPDAIREAERRLARAREDITIRSLEKTADAERSSYDDSRSQLRDALEERLTTLEEHWGKELNGWGGFLTAVAALMGEFGLTLDPSISAALAGVSTVGAGKPGGTLAQIIRRSQGPTGSGSFGGGLQHGGPALAGRDYLVGEAGPELLRMGASSGRVSPLGAGGIVWTGDVIVQGSVLTDRTLTEAVYAGLLEKARSGGPLFSRVAGVRV